MRQRFKAKVVNIVIVLIKLCFAPHWLYKSSVLYTELLRGANTRVKAEDSLEVCLTCPSANTDYGCFFGGWGDRYNSKFSAFNTKSRDMFIPWVHTFKYNILH